jgi:hypothetical protein
VFAPGITIEDNLAVLVGYRSGTTLTYSLNAHSPWEGYRVALNGTAGRLELAVVERGHVRPTGTAGMVDRPAIDPSLSPDHPAAATATNPRPAGAHLRLQHHWSLAQDQPIPHGDGPHGGGDTLLLDDIFLPTPTPDPLRRRAGLLDGLRASGIGIAANHSLETGHPVRLSESGVPLGSAGNELTKSDGRT